jgi:osmotically-inducible protein OsmY
MKDEERIVKQIRGAFEYEPRINLHRYPLSIEVGSDGSLTLEGEVADLAAKKLCLELAASVTGVNGIIDRLRVAPAERMGDGEIRDHVRDALIEEPALDGCSVRIRSGAGLEVGIGSSTQAPSIEIFVNEGVVTLDGSVKSLSHKRLAGVLAWWVRGTRDVVNGLEVAPPQEDSDDEITEALRVVLEKDPIVNAGAIRVTTRDTVVTLDGLAANDQEMRAAESDAWFVFGVNKVVNHLEVRA